MALSRSRLAALIINIVVLTLLVAFAIATLVMRLAGDWEAHAWGLMLTLKIMWGSWLLLLATVVLTRVTIAGWRFRKLRPGEMPAALRRAIAEGVQPASLFKSGTTSFTITVVLVSLLGAATLASVLIWIIGDWQANAGPLWVALRVIWGTWWVLCIATVLVRIALFNKQRKQALLARASAAPGANGQTGQAGQGEATSTETATGTSP